MKKFFFFTLDSNVIASQIFVITCLLIVLLLIAGTNTKNASAQGDRNSVIWSEWGDQDKQFTLQYPSGWIAIPREIRFEDQDVMFLIDRNGSNFNINVYNTSSKPTKLRAIIDRAVNASFEASSATKRFEGPDYNPYSVSGKPAGAVIWITQKPFNDKFVTLSVSSIVGDKFVAIMYNSSPEDFDKYLPIVNRIIQSVKIK